MSEDEIQELPTAELWVLFQERTGNFRLVVAHEIARRLHHDKNWIELIAICETALESSDIDTDYFLKGRFNFEIGYANYSLGRFNESVTAYLASIPNFRQAGNFDYVPTSIRNACDGFLALEDYEEVLRQVDTGLEVCELENDLRFAGDLLMRRGSAFVGLENAEAALGAFTDARNQFQTQRNSDGMIAADNERISLLWELDRNADAVAVAERVFVMARHSTEPRDLIVAGINLADALNREGMHDKCAVLCDETESDYIRYASPSQKARMLYEWAVALAGLGSFPEAAKLFRETRTLAEYGNDTNFQALALSSLYNCWMGRDTTEMRMALWEMISLASRKNLPDDLFRARNRLLDLELELNDQDMALVQIEEIEKLNRDGISAFDVSQYYELKALYLFREGELAAAQDAVEAGLSIAKRGAHPMTKAELHALRAIVLIEMGLIAPGDGIAGRALAFAIRESVYELAGLLAEKMLPEPDFQPQLRLDLATAE